VFTQKNKKIEETILATALKVIGECILEKIQKPIIFCAGRSVLSEDRIIRSLD